MTEETLGRPSCLPISRPDLKPTHSPSLRGWRNTRLAQKNNSTTLSIVTVLGAWWTAKNPFSLTSRCKTLINCKKASFWGVRAFIVRETQSDSGLILRKKIVYLSCMLHAPPFAICTQHILSYENPTVFVLRRSHQGLIILESSIFQEKIGQRNKPCNNCF